ncbi:DNA primase [candidate division WWE3 bacterium CG_4_9_14_0_2_um_filter_35_11]|uniref:DNA primase n=1 Tax=candidate division WWE3 bacterium CG_4_9_14_0_2_um_filter_35_11 TaxID=1975077 RepID=A0A2M8EM16_UNCKA|nr:MAG: DNA primase [candidate division WWE3 bacterium CG10_big_fil_rev_8_21_14_0_10_35_32]PJC23727.1 MAG: DNA primase [candidate division WWE3 bacterium CG_4_9_14_0_2_um_filter_35_11]
MDSISEVKSKINIVDLIGTYTPLKQSGKNHKGLCPFHSEKTPSFMVSEDLQRYRCFGCGKSGDIFNFIMDIEGVEFFEALKVLAERAGVKIDLKPSGFNKKSKDATNRIYEINEAASKFYQHLLNKHEFGQVGRDYIKTRKVSAKIVKDFGIGYAPNSWDSLSRYLISKEFTAEEIIHSGLGKYRKSSKNTYDIFRGRLVFPLRDNMGRILGFSGRALFEDQDPRYINTSETEVFHKERFLFGLDLAKTAIRKNNLAIIVEGEFDMISPFQAGFENIVASKGTALTVGQVNLLKRYAQTIVLIFDNDVAGADASIRGIDIIKDCGLDIKIAVLPEGLKDPDELIKKDKDLFGDVVKNALPLWDYYFSYASSKYNLSNIFEKKKASGFLIKIIKEIDDEVVQSSYIKKFSVLFDVDESVVKNQLDKSVALNRDRFTADVPEKIVLESGFEDYPGSEIYVLTLLMDASKDEFDAFSKIINPDFFTNEFIRDLFLELGVSMKSSKNFDAKAFYDKILHSHPNVYSLFEKVYLRGRFEDSRSLGDEIVFAILRLKQAFQKRRRKELAVAIAKAEAVSDSSLVARLQKEVKEVSDL